MKKTLVAKNALQLLSAFFLMFPVAHPSAANDLPDEIPLISQKFSEEVGRVILSDEYETLLADRAMTLLSRNLPALSEKSQYFLLTDRNPKAQVVSLAFFDSRKGSVIILGSHKTSTGNPRRSGFYETPIGVFKNTPAHMSYRALGTKNSKGWRGFGAKGSRVWDLGWQESRHPKGGPIHIRLLVHATDPDLGEPKLGTPDSKGCIRIPAKLNRFLDHYGILDAEYEKNEKAKYVLLKNRSPVTLAGRYVVVVDSGL